MYKLTQPLTVDCIQRFMVVWFFCVSLPAYAESGINWLANQAHTGGISTADDVATPFQATAETLRTIHVFGEDTTFSSVVDLGHHTLKTENYRNTENVSRHLIATAEKGDDVLALVKELLAFQNFDGGFGEIAGFDSTVLNTAFALEALAIAEFSGGDQIEQALAFLTSQQNPDGSFILNSANENSIYVTALAATALQQFLFRYQVVNFIEKANQYLLDQISQTQITTDWELALSLLSVASAIADTSRYKSAAQTLLSHQNPNGSWDNDVYITALALRALHHVQYLQFPADPDKGTFTGRVLNDNTGLPLAKVTVLLEAAKSVQTLTKSDGTYDFEEIDPGTYTLKYQLSGYNTALLQSVNLVAGQFAELETIRLIPLPEVGLISGMVTDTATSQPLANVLVTVSGITTASTQTDEDGFYSIVSPPGSVTVTLTKTGYDTLSGTGTVAKGTTLSFSPQLNPIGTTPSNPEVTIKGFLKDSETGAPLANALITVVGTDYQVRSDETGAFSLSGVAPGELTVEMSFDGYQVRRLTVLALPGAVVDLDTTHLSKTVTTSTTTLIGRVVNANTGEPIEGANITLETLSSRALTDADGNYRIEDIDVLKFKVMANALNYLTASYTLSINQAGLVVVDFKLTPAIPDVTIKGFLKDSETGTPLANALITVVGTDYQVRSDETGAFSLSGVAPGELTVEMSLDGYQRGRLTVLAPPGTVVDLDTTHLLKTATTPTTTLIGQVVNANTGEPIEGANITLETLSSGALTDADGNYRIEDIEVLEFKVMADALNYLTASYTLSINQAGLVVVDFKLTPAIESPLEITSVTLEQASYHALNAVYMDVVLNNQAATAQPVRLSIKVVNESHEIVEQFTPIINNLVTVEANSPLSTRLEWQTARHQPGDYDLIIQAFDGNSGRLLAEQGTPVSIEPTNRIGGHVAFIPPIAQLAAKKPVKITATIANQGNQPLEATTVTATLSLKNKGYQQRKNEFIIEPFVQDSEFLNYPRGIDQDAAGNFYIADYRNNSVLKITPEGTVSEFATDLYYPIDVDLDHQGNLLVLSYYSNRDKSLVRLGTDGSRTNIKLNTVVGYPQALEVLDDGRILIATDSALYAVTLEANNSQANTTMLVGRGLNAPLDLVADSHGNLFITDKGSDAIAKFAGNKLSIWATDIKQPSGITIDADDNLYVTSLGDNSLLKITSKGEKSVIASGLAGPYDVKIAPDGNFVVSNSNAHEIVTITPEGEVSVRVPATLYAPYALTYDTEGHLYVGNYNRRNIIQLASDGTVTNWSDGIIIPRDLLAIDNHLYWLESNRSLSTMVPNDSAKTTLTSQLRTPYALIKAPTGDGFLVSESSAHQISQVSTIGEITPYTTLTLFTQPLSLRRDAQGYLYLLSGDGYITQFTETGQIIRVISGLSAPRGLAIDNDGNLIVSGYDNKNKGHVLRIDSSGKSEVLADNLSFDNLPIRPHAIAINSQGEIVVAPWNHDTLYLIENDGGVSEYAKLNEGKTGYDMLFDASDNLWISQYYQRQVLKLTADRAETVVYPLINNRYSPQALFPDGTGGVLVGGYQYIQEIDSQGNIAELVYGDAVKGQNLRGIALDKAGQLWIADTNSGILSRLKTDYTLEKRYASLYYPKGLAWIDNSLIVAATGRKSALLRITGGSLPEIILDGSYEQVEVLDSQTLLLSNASSVSRFDVITQEVTPLVSGFIDIEALTVGADGHFVVADSNYNRNKLAFFDSDGKPLDSFIGLVSPKGLLFDAEGQLLVTNTFPNGISRVRADGYLQPFSSAVNSVESMWLEEADGQITVSRNSDIITLSKTGEWQKSFQVPSYTLKGLHRDATGDLWIISDNQGALLKMAPDGSVQKMASGLSQPHDIEVDLEGNIHFADYGRGVVTRVNADNSLSLVASDLPRAEAITFTPDGTLFVNYNNKQIAGFTANGERTELPIADIIPLTISGLTHDSQSNLYLVMANTNQMLKIILSQPAGTVIEPGEVLYTATANLPALDLESEAVTVDFGAWTPTLSGDFEVEVTAATPTTTVQLNNTLHVGPSAHGTLSLAQSQVFPGDRAVVASLILQGADSTSITQIDPQGTTLAASSGTSGYGIAADNQGNIYSVDRGRKRIVKITPNGTVSDFVTDLKTIEYGLAIDAQDNIYAGSAKTILKITPPSEAVTTPQVTTFATLSGTVEAIAVNYDNQIYAIDSTNRLSRIAADGSVKTLTTAGLNNPRGLTIDVFGNFYVLNAGSPNDLIIKITPDGKSSSLFFNQANFEFEGVNMTADCSNNLLFAPYDYFAPFNKNIGEETTLVQLIGDTGEVREILYGPSIDRAMADMDVLFYDRFGQRLLIWTDLNQGKIFSFPIICGGIDVDVHIKTRADVELASSEPTPMSVAELEDGTQEVIWNLSQVDNQGQKIQLNLQFDDLVEGEKRPAVQEAFLVFHNSFDPDNPVQVTLTIPELLATRQLHIAPMLNEERYGPKTPVEIQVEVLNDSDTHFEGTLELAILDSQNYLVADLPPIAVTDLAGPTSQFYASQWNTDTYYAGNYKLVSRLVDSVRTYDEAELAFEIVIPETAAQLSLRTTTDKSAYHTTDIIQINNLVRSLSPNRLIDDALVTVTITDPNGQVIHTEDQPLGALVPDGMRDLMMPYQLNKNALLGTYTVQVTIADSETQLASQQTSFEVTEQVELALLGHVEVQTARMTTNQTQTCTETITHQGTQAINNLALQRLLIDLETLALLDVQTTTVDLAAGAQQTFSRTFEPGSLKPSHYACLLQMQVGQTWKPLDFKSFTVTGTLSSECNTVYAIHDQNVSDTQLFTYALDSGVIQPLGPLYPGYDLEGLDIHPYTHQLYASSGKKRSRLYHVDGDRGDLNLIGDIGFKHVNALSFHPDGSLWGWAREGLIQINIETGQGKLMYAENKNIEGLAWNQDGTLLYGTLYDKPRRQSTLWVYDGQSLTKSCENLPGEVESLEMRPDGTFVFGVHEQEDMNFHVYDVKTCQVLAEAPISTTYDDIEAIAWPSNSCTANQQALKAFLTALSDNNAFIGEDRNLRITLENQSYRGQLAVEITSGPAPVSNNLYLEAWPDANDDGIDDFRIIYPNGDKQVLYYFGNVTD